MSRLGIGATRTWRRIERIVWFSESRFNGVVGVKGRNRVCRKGVESSVGSVL